MNSLAYIIVGFTTASLVGLWRAYVISILWAWFIVTTFAAPPLSLAAAWGVSALVTLLTFQVDVDKEPSGKSKGERLFTLVFLGLLLPALCLLSGYIGHHFL